jgi:hypothetical protein
VRHTQVFCDRCRREITDQPGVIEFRATGALLPALDRVDLCGECAARLLEWLRAVAAAPEQGRELSPLLMDREPFHP